MPRRQSVFIPNNFMGTRRDTATLLVGTAREFGIHQRDIMSTYNGFYITPELEAILYEESDEAEAIEEQQGETIEEIAADLVTEDTTKTSGNRAAKTNSQKGK